VSQLRSLNALGILLAVGCWCWLSPPALYAQENTLWQIGEFDQSSEEFGVSFGFGSLPSAPPDPVYRVGTSDWKKDWSGFQPGSANGPAGSREHPFTVLFSLTGRPQGLYKLTVGVLPYMPRRPNLRVEVNGKRGMYYLRPRLSYDLGNFPTAFIPQYSYARLNIEIPPAFLQSGENKLVLTCLDDPAAPDNSYGTVGTGDSGIFYDALKFTQDPSGKFSPAEIRGSATPTVFYRQTGKGLTEVVEAIVGLNRKIPQGRVELDCSRWRQSVALSSQADFGEQLITFDVPEWTGTANASLRIQAGGTRTFAVNLEAQRKWTVYVVPHTHLDIGYTDYQGKVAEAQPRVLDQAAELIRQHSEFRFSMDASWNMEQLLHTRSKAKQEEILDLIRHDQIAIPAQYCNLLTGYASLETLYRSLYFSKSLARREGLPFEYANITDVPSYSGSYPSVLASAGVKYWIAAGNNWRAPFLIYGKWNEKSPFWWKGPDGKKVLFWYSRHYMQIESLFALPPVLPAVRDSLPVFLQAYETPEYRPDAVLVYGTQAENTDLVPGAATFVQAWDHDYAYPKLQYSTFPDFFKYISGHYGKNLPTYQGDGGPYWEDGVGSDALYTAVDRENQERALSAEILSSLTHILNPDLHPPKELTDDIWRNIVLFAEHTWASWNSMTQPDHAETIRQLEVKDSRATTARLEINDLMNRSLSQLGDQVHVPADTLIVFNSLSWQRDAIVEADLFDHAKLKDLTTQENVPFEVLWAKQGFLHVRFLAQGLPAVGYKCYAISYHESDPVAPPAAEVKRATVVENSFYRVTLDPASGAVASIFDKQLKREIVDTQSRYRFDQYLYVTGGDGNTQIMRPISTWPRAQLTVHSAAEGELVGITRIPFGQSIRLRSRALHTPRIETEILLFDDAKKIEFINHVTKESVTTKEGAYFAFPVAAKSPQFAYATQQAWIDPAHDLLKGASLEWFSVQKWMASRDRDLTVGITTPDAPLASLGDINRGMWPSEFQPKSSTLFSYVMNNYWDTNYRAAQGGEFTFRYTMTSAAKLDLGALTRLGWESMRPVEVDYVVGQDKVGNPPRPLPAAGASFLEVNQPDVVLVDWKISEDGRGTILRLQETAGNATTTVLKFACTSVKSAALSNGLEDDVQPLKVEDNSVKLAFQPNEVLTVRVQ
jgi:alpha-mannosidase